MSGFAEKNGWICHIETNDTPAAYTLSATAKRNIFLMLKECLQNTYKHAGASEVWLHWECTPGQLRLCYADNGRGLTPQENTGGYGLRNMRERALQTGAELHIGNRTQGGIQITLILHLENTPKG